MDKERSAIDTTGFASSSITGCPILEGRLGVGTKWTGKLWIPQAGRIWSPPLPHVRVCVHHVLTSHETRPQLLGGHPFVWWRCPLSAGFWISAMERISTCCIPTLLKRISLIERVIDIDDCLTMFALSQIVSMYIPFFSRFLSVSC